MGKQLTVGSLFSGIGGFDLGLERAGMRVIWQSETNPYASRVLLKHWPDIPNLGDIKEIDFERVERPDVVCGGYPCQPFSNAGYRGGADDPRHLWPECLRALRILRPRYALFENVRGHISLGFPEVLSDLAHIGFDAEWQIVSAAAVGAPHKRDRLFILAYPASGSRGQPESHGLLKAKRETTESRESVGPKTSRNDWWQTEPDVGRVADGVPARVDKLRALGNAVVPQVVEYIGSLIVAHENQGDTRWA